MVTEELTKPASGGSTRTAIVVRNVIVSLALLGSLVLFTLAYFGTMTATTSHGDMPAIEAVSLYAMRGLILTILTTAVAALVSAALTMILMALALVASAGRYAAAMPIPPTDRI